MRDARPLATPGEVAEYLRKPVGTLANWRYQRIGPKWIKAEGSVRYRWSDVDTWLDAQSGGAAA